MRVLLADDDGIARLLISRLLISQGYEVVAAADGETALELLRQPDAPLIMVVDWMIRGVSAESLCQEMRMRAGMPPGYLIALVSRKQERDCALVCGCDDFLMKPVDAIELRTRMSLASRLTEISERMSAAQSSGHTEASHDRLTGIWNRAAITQFLSGQFARSTRDGISMALAVADLDHFSQFNERHGRAAGDALLRQVASRIRSVVRPYDWLGRLEQDSFLIIAPDCTLSNGFAMCERLRSVIAEIGLQHESWRGVTMSFGLATSAESGVTNEEALLRAAEAALYQAKQNGRNRVEMARRTARVRSVQPKAPQSQGRELVQ